MRPPGPKRSGSGLTWHGKLSGVNLVAYFKARRKPLVFGFLIGLIAGVARVSIFVPQDVPDSARLFLILQIAVAFSALGLFISNYLELRQRVFQKVKDSQRK